jgi:hypothetical protein
VDRYRPAGRRPAARQLSRTSAVRSAISFELPQLPFPLRRHLVAAVGLRRRRPPGPLEPRRDPASVFRSGATARREAGRASVHSAGTVRGAGVDRSRGSGGAAGASGEVSRVKFALSRADECFLGSSRDFGELPARLPANRAEPPVTPREPYDRATGASRRTTLPSLEAELPSFEL